MFIRASSLKYSRKLSSERFELSVQSHPSVLPLLYLLVSRFPSLRGGRGLFTLVLPGLLILLVKSPSPVWFPPPVIELPVRWSFFIGAFPRCLSTKKNRNVPASVSRRRVLHS